MQAYVNKCAIVSESKHAPNMFGSLDETIRKRSGLLGDFRTAYYNEHVPDSPVYEVAYDNANLYIRGSCSREEADSLAHIEIVFQTLSSSDTYYVAAFSVNDSSRLKKTNWSDGSGHKRQNIDGLRYSLSANDSAGIRIEAVVPLSAIDPTLPVTPGNEWNMNIIHVHPINSRPLLSWVPIRTSRYTDLGEDVALAANVVDQDRLGTVFFHNSRHGELWIPDNWKLDYVSFTEKRLIFGQCDASLASLQLQWKSPTKDWIELEQVQWAVKGSGIHIDFHHPEPLHAGMYQLKCIAASPDESNNKFTIISFDRESLIEAGELANRSASSAEEVKSKLAPPTEGASAAVPISLEVQKLLAMIPIQRGFGHLGLPEKPYLRPENLYTLSSDGLSLIAKETGNSYPNEQYPENKALIVVNKKGEQVQFPYAEDAEGRKYFFTAFKWNLQMKRVIDAIASKTHEEPLGAARLLYRLAQKFEGYVPNSDRPWNTYPFHYEAGPPFNETGGLWSAWFYTDMLILEPLLLAFSKLNETSVFAVLSAEIGEDTEQKIVEQMFIPSIQYVLSFPCRHSNLDPYILRGLVMAGKAIKRPEYIHLAVEWMNDYVKSQFLADGFWKEITLSYHNQVWGSIEQAIIALNGYSDPENYRSPRSGRRFDRLDLLKEYAVLARGLEIGKKLVYPSGTLLPVQDTWAASKSQFRADSASLLVPSAGMGRLTLGQGTAQTQLYMMFTPKYGHNQKDPLNLTLFAEGQELLPDLGYTYTKYRQFASSTVGHNTVVVNGKDMNMNGESRHGGNIEQFVAEDGLFQAMRASEPEAYAETAEYSRELWLVPFANEESNGYVLDLFRVAGGDRHEYTLQGDANRDSLFLTELPLASYSPYLLPTGTKVQEPKDYYDFGSAEGFYPGYQYVREVQQADLKGDRYEVTLITKDDDGTEQAKLSITGLLADGHNELYLGRSPSIRTTRLHGIYKESNDETEKYSMPKLLLRREGSNLQSTFMTLMEPFRGSEGQRIQSIDRLQLEKAPDGAVAIQITYGGTTDILLSNPHYTEQPLSVGDIAFHGSMGMIRLVDGAVREMVLVGGTLLKKGRLEITGDGAITGTIVGTLRRANGDAYDALLTNTPVSPDVKGKYVIVKHPDQSTNGYLIGDVRVEGGQTSLVLAEHDPGFEMNPDGTSKQLFYPAKRWSGPHTFVIANVEKQHFS